MHPYAIEHLASSRACDLQEQADRHRRAGVTPWDHRWRRGLGEALIRAGRRLQS